MSKDYFVYTHSKPNGDIFYVGKADHNRVKHVNRKSNPRHCNIVNKHGKENIVIKSMLCRSEQHAFDLEVKLIKALRDGGADLCNVTDGGSGASGWNPPQWWRDNQAARMRNFKHTPETLAKISAANKGKVLSAETRAKVSLGLKNMSPENRAKVTASFAKRPPPSSETKFKMSKSQQGRKHSADTLKKMSESQIGRVFSPSHREKLRIANLGKSLTEETKQKLRESSLKEGRGFTSEIRAKIEETRKIKRELLVAERLLNPVEKKIRPSPPRKPKSEWKKAPPHSEETKQKLREANLGKKASPEVKAKMSESHKNREKTYSAETRAKLAYNAANVSEETKSKRSATRAAKKALIPEDERLRIEKERRDLKNKKRRERKGARRLAEGVKPRPADCWERTAATRKANRDPNLSPEKIKQLDARCAKHKAKKLQITP